MEDLKYDTEDAVFDTLKKRWEGLNYLRAMLGDEQIEYLSLGSFELFNENQRDKFQACLEQMAYLNQKLKDITGISEVYQEASEQCDFAGFNGFKHAISNKAEGQLNTGLMMQSLINTGRTG